MGELVSFHSGQYCPDFLQQKREPFGLSLFFSFLAKQVLRIAEPAYPASSAFVSLREAYVPIIGKKISANSIRSVMAYAAMKLIGKIGIWKIFVAVLVRM